MKIGKLKLRRLQPSVIPVMHGDSELLVYNSLWRGRIHTSFYASTAQFLIQSDRPKPTSRQTIFVESILSYSRSIREEIESRVTKFVANVPDLNLAPPSEVVKNLCEPIVVIPMDAEIVLPTVEFLFMLPLDDGVRSIDVRIDNWNVKNVLLDAG